VPVLLPLPIQVRLLLQDCHLIRENEKNQKITMMLTSERPYYELQLRTG
jgi:hypothetical protein